MGAWGVGSDENDDTFNFLTDFYVPDVPGEEKDPAKKYDVSAIYKFLKETEMLYEYISDVGMMVYFAKNKKSFPNLPKKAVKTIIKFIDQEMAELTSDPLVTTRTWDPADYPERISKLKKEKKILENYLKTQDSKKAKGTAKKKK